MVPAFCNAGIAVHSLRNYTRTVDVLPDDYRFETVSLYGRRLSREPHKEFMTL